MEIRKERERQICRKFILKMREELEYILKIDQLWGFRVKVLQPFYAALFTEPCNNTCCLNASIKPCTSGVAAQFPTPRT